MPIVNIRFDPKLFSDEQMQKIRTSLPAVVAVALSDSASVETILDPSQIHLEFSEVHRLDTNAKPIRLLVFCEGFLQRLLDVDHRATIIAEAIRLLDSCFSQDTATGWVWIYPSPKTGFCEISEKP